MANHMHMDDDDCRQEDREKMVGWFERVFHILNAYQSHQDTAKGLRMSQRTMQLALGFHLAAGADGPAKLAKQCGVSKQTLGKCLNHFLEQLKIEPMPFQRNGKARRHMALARKEQVKKARGGKA